MCARLPPPLKFKFFQASPHAFEHKKKTWLFHSPVYYTIKPWIRQYFVLKFAGRKSLSSISSVYVQGKIFGDFQWNKKIFPLDILSRPLYLRSDAHRSKGHQGQLGQLELLEAKGNADDGHAEQKAYQSVLQSQRKP